MQVEIRKATEADAAVLAQLGATTFYDTFHSFHSDEDMQLYLAKAYHEPDILRKLNDPSIQYHLAYDGPTPVGYTKLLLHSPHPKLSGNVIELEKIYVLQSYFDKKIGKQLMDHAITFSRENNFQVLYLGVWQENHRAVNFYKKAGFEVFDTRTFQLGKTNCDDYLMRYTL